MPSKPQSKKSTLSGEENFVLKHRIAGAGFLLFFGALVLPWLLGPPSEAIKLSEDTLVVAQQISGVIDKSSQEGVAQKNPIPQQEQVYISKITPLDRGANAQSSNSTNGATKKLLLKDKSGGKEKLNDSQAVQQKSENKTSASIKLKQGSTKLAEGSSKLAEGSSKSAEGSSKLAEGSSKLAEGSSKSEAAGSGNQVSTKAPLQVPAPTKVDVGWVVQVGVFTDKRGAAKVVDDLRDKGFNPSTSIVDTNRGKATGTRIWLGPYAQRVEAAKSKTLLTSKTGEAGFIRAYP